MEYRQLCIILPCFNEARTIERVVRELDALEAPLSALGVRTLIVAIDDCSTDGTWQVLQTLTAERPGRMEAFRHERNCGKGAAIRTARTYARGDFVIFQDADLEYDPLDIPRLLPPLLDGRADAVLGSRFAVREQHEVRNFWHRVGNNVLTLFSNVFTGLDLSDMETGYKAFRMDVFRQLHLTTDRFGMEPEIVGRLGQMQARVYEIPISYHRRWYAEGKKITWRDGVAAFGHILRTRFSGRHQPPLRSERPVRTSPSPSLPRAAVKERSAV